MPRQKAPPKKNKRKGGTGEYITHNLHTTAPLTTLRQIKALQKSTKLLIPKLSLSRLIREIIQKLGDYKIQYMALEALHEALEIYLVDLFTDSQKLCAHANRVTVKPKDMRLVLDLRGYGDPAHDYYFLQ